MDQFSVDILTSLQIPDSWVAMAKVLITSTISYLIINQDVQGSHYRSLGRQYQAYEEFVKADDQVFAHDIAVFELAPEIVIRENFDFMTKLFEPLDPSRIPVEQWEDGGKVSACLTILSQS